MSKEVNRNSRAYHKKLSWALKNIDKDFLLEFKTSYDNNSFKSVKAAEVLAAEVYKMNCEDYKKTKATVSVIQGIKHVTKKIKDMPTTSAGVNTQEMITQINKREIEQQIKSDLLDMLKERAEKIVESVTMNLNELKYSVNK